MNGMSTTPPPLPPAYVAAPRKPDRPGVKIVLMTVQCVVLMIATLIVWGLVYDRQSSVNDVADSIADEWGGKVRIGGPFVMAGDSVAAVSRTLRCDVSIESKTLHRGIYEAEVYDAAVEMSGSFDALRLPTGTDDVRLTVRVPARKIYRIEPLRIAGRTVEWRRDGGSLVADIDASALDDGVTDFDFSFRIHGSGSIEVVQSGQHTVVTMEGEARNPSFTGSSLPDDRSVTDRTFSAKWESNSVMTADACNSFMDNDRSILGGEMDPEMVYVIEEPYDLQVIGAKFLVGVDRYRKVSRSLKFAFIIIVLTFISLFFTEVITKRAIPMFNCFLIGAALVMFYLLLLSFVEFVSFGMAYLVASVMTIALIGGYMWRMLASVRTGVTIASILTLIYSCCYVMLCLGRYALALGSLILFASLAAMMWASLKLKR